MHKRIAILTGKGISLKVVSEDIAYSALKNGNVATVNTYMCPPLYLARNFDKIIIFIPFDLNYVLSWVSLYHTLNKVNKDVLFYTTVEGIPAHELIKEWLPSVVQPIANSEATASFLKEVGIKVAGIVKHGINIDLFKQVRKHITKVKKDSVVFGTVAFSHPRKGFDELEQIIKMASQSLPKATFHIISDNVIYERFLQYPNVIVEPLFSQLKRTDILKKIGSFDFYICTSKAEGFCLPVLESQALGIPVIHADYKPLSEISFKDNFMVKVNNVVDCRFEEAIIYRFHMYDVNEMFDKVVEAYNMYVDDYDKYLSLSEKLIKYANNFNAVKMYKPLVS